MKPKRIETLKWAEQCASDCINSSVAQYGIAAVKVLFYRNDYTEIVFASNEDLHLFKMFGNYIETESVKFVIEDSKEST